MIVEAFDKVDLYCKVHGKGTSIRNQAFCIFVLSFRKAINDLHSAKNKEPKRQEIKSAIAALLTEENLANYIAKAEEMLRHAEADLLRAYTPRPVKSTFAASLIASILGAFIYSVVLLLLYLIIVRDITGLIDFISSGVGGNN